MKRIVRGGVTVAILALLAMLIAGCGLITVGDKAGSSADKGRPQDFGFVRVLVNWPRLDNPGYKYSFGEAYIPITWSGNSFTGSFSGESVSNVSGQNRCSVSGTISADSSKLENFKYVSDLKASTTSGQSISMILLPLPRSTVLVNPISYVAINKDCAKYAESLNASGLSDKGSFPLPLNWAEGSIISIGFLAK